MRSRMGQGTVRLTGLMPIRNRDGSTRWYYRAKGAALTRLPDLPHDDPAFLTAYAAARSSVARAGARPGPGTIGAAVVVALQSADYTSASAGYRKHLRPHLEAIRKAGGAAMVRDLRPGHIERDLASLTPHVARARLKAWRMICRQIRWADHRTTDPAAAVTPPKAPSSDGHRPWTTDEVSAFRARWPVGSVALTKITTSSGKDRRSDPTAIPIAGARWTKASASSGSSQTSQTARLPSTGKREAGLRQSARRPASVIAAKL